jgi:N-acetylmuramoyl-L-alanine amidase
MKKNYTLIYLLVFSFIVINAQDKNFIRMVVPEKDSASSYSGFQRLNACTLPGSAVRINNEEYKVYPTGAFAGYIKLNPGTNRLFIESVHPKAGNITKTIILNYTPREPEKAVTSFSIESANVIPALDQELQTGDVIQVRMKAKPGYRAYFLKNKPMYELPETQTGGIAGIYQGSYEVQSSDTINETTVDFTLAGFNGETVNAVSKNKISANTGEFPAIACSKGTFPYFCFGLGEDRLGGAKVSYLDTMVYMTLDGRAGNFYRVKLGETQSVYIPRDNVTLMPKGTFAPWSLTDSWSVSGDDKYDYLRISLSQRIPYVSTFEINPARIILDLYGATSNTNWITQMNSTREIKNVYYEQPEKNVMRVIIELKHRQAWGYTVFYERNRLVVKIKQQPEKLDLSHLTIGLDAGHGGSADGALGSTGTKEKDINIDVVMRMKAALEKAGAKVALTRQADEDLATIRRWQIWQKAEPDIVLSFHCNSIGNSDPTKVKGTSTYYKYIPFRPLSMIMYDELLKTGLSEFGNVGSFNFTLNAPTDFPNTLIEMAFMSNPEDETLLLDNNFRDKVVKGVMVGLKRYLKQCK